MSTEKIIIANLKCAGCQSTIKNKLSEMKGVSGVNINDEEDSVTITHEDALVRQDFVQKLHDLGYPEATEENGLLLKLKSYASCVAGRIDNMKK